MNKIIFGAAFVIGALVILWTGLLFLGADTFGLAITLLIGGVYAIGTVELIQFRKATSSLKQALSSIKEPVVDLAQWLNDVSPSLQNSVRLRAEGERVALPAPVLTPYLVGLLVMLGLLGTFIGMVATLKGAVVALEGSSELEAIRAGLAAPIEGLGLAFGTSVAGVAASAMLGLLSTLSRRERLQASYFLDAKVSQEFSHFSARHQQHLAFKAIQDQAQALPAVAEKLNGLATSLETMGDTIGERLLANQHQFQETLSTLYAQLNESVDSSLKSTLVESAGLINDRLQPMAEKTFEQLVKSNEQAKSHLNTVSEAQLKALNESAQSNSELVRSAVDSGIAKQGESAQALVQVVNDSVASAVQQLQLSRQELTKEFTQSREQFTDSQQQLSQHSEQQLAVLNDAVSNNANTVRQALDDSLTKQDSVTQALMQNVNESVTSIAAEMQTSQKEVLKRFSETSDQWSVQQQQSADKISDIIGQQLDRLRKDESKRGEASVAHLSQLETTVAAQLSSLGLALEEPMTRLIETASQTPKAAAEVIEKLRGEMTKNLERDNDLLSERTRLMAQLETLSNTLESSSKGQREAINSLIERSADTLSQVGEKFSERLQGESSKLADVVQHFAGSSADMASLGDAFNAAVMRFSETNNELVENLNRIESALDKSSSRSDEQLAYYVSQAREIIDHNLLSHQQIISALNAKKPQQLSVSEAG